MLYTSKATVFRAVEALQPIKFDSVQSTGIIQPSQIPQNCGSEFSSIASSEEEPLQMVTNHSQGCSWRSINTTLNPHNQVTANTPTTSQLNTSNTSSRHAILLPTRFSTC